MAILPKINFTDYSTNNATVDKTTNGKTFLIDFQKKLEGDIENEYFDKNPFGNYKSQYYCEERFLKLCSQKVAELESEIEEKQFRELEELQKLEQLQSGI